jgi:23S rRNA pseudouridine1911/1915/1917 synthase
MNGTEYPLIVAAAYTGERLDKFLADALPKTSRAQAQRLLAQGFVQLAGAPCTDASRKLQAGEQLRVYVPKAEPSALTPVNLPLDVLYEDADLLVINKQAGLTVHPAPGEKGATLVHALLHHCGKSLSGIGGVQRPGIVHRLDKETSGAMIVAKHDAAHQSLTQQLQSRQLKRMYHALCYGVPQPTSGMWEGAIGRSPQHRKKMAVLTKGGKEARTHYQVLEVLGGGAVSLVECQLDTGRTHQIRVHFAHHGYPLVGDPVYGRPRKLQNATLAALLRSFKRQALHARSLAFLSPNSGLAHCYEAPYPEDFAGLLTALRSGI